MARALSPNSVPTRYEDSDGALFKVGATYWGMWADSKSVNCGFESCHLCKARPYNLAGVDRANAVACDGKDCAHWP